MIYLDHNATTPPAPEVLDAMGPVFVTAWANASSQHGPGQDAKRVLGAARATAAKALGCKTSELIFTSGATEANHMALTGLLATARAQGRQRLLIGAVEHSALLRLARSLAEQGVPVDVMPVSPDGRIDLTAAAALMGPDLALVSLMAANNETGALMPVTEVAAMAHAAGAAMHVDATQWIGKLPFAFSEYPADAVSLSAHKFHGPKGAGALLLRQGRALVPPVPGSQERGRRGGTENLPAIVGLAAALERLGDLAVQSERAEQVASLRDALERGLAELPGLHVWCQGVPRLPGTSYLRFGMVDADVVLQRLSRLNVAASSGAACSSGGSEPSHVLTAMGVPRDEALCAIRFSLGDETQSEDIALLLNSLPALLEPLLSVAAES
ncbi:cysteine desulfurase family protein [Hydrogenophaga sp. SL48]|uniref:cysteine desulfurase family protein n=1 Tax=Hydrogenophaga sp. SL48 TaxID=2806347 RepID=UPI001F25651E|nr:cysteine desulfurase family protein [Hydrogenophaga sp. SL48]UJW82535.1 cysteine desulfurase [Hydrogenophaga sp. SL48]